MAQAKEIDTLFADTGYWIALIDPRDAWHGRAREVSERQGRIALITTQEVLGELLTFCSNRGSQMRVTGAILVRRLLDHPEVEVLPQSRNSFLDGLAHYELRVDKAYSFTDCVSMQVMRKRNIIAALTGDHHFEQEGFQALLRD